MFYVINAIIGILLGLLNIALGFEITSWQWWLIVVGGALPFNIIAALIGNRRERHEYND